VDPTFLTLDEVLEIHRDQLDRYGGHPGIRDLGLLQSYEEAKCGSVPCERW
jgi:death-on-curing protein